MIILFHAEARYNQRRESVDIIGEVQQQPITFSFSRVGLCDYFRKPDTEVAAFAAFANNRQRLLSLAERIHQTEPALVQNNCLTITRNHLENFFV